MLVRSAFLEGGERYEQIWSKNPPSFVLQFCERVVMLEGTGYSFPVVIPWAASLWIALASVATATLAGLGPAVFAMRQRIPEAIAQE